MNIDWSVIIVLCGLCGCAYLIGYAEGQIKGAYITLKQLGKIPADWTLEDFRKAMEEK